MIIIIISKNEAVSRVHMPTSRIHSTISTDLPTQSHSQELRQTNQYEVDAAKFIKTVLNENVLLIQHQGGFHFLCLMYLKSTVIILNIILFRKTMFLFRNIIPASGSSITHIQPLSYSTTAMLSIALGVKP